MKRSFAMRLHRPALLASALAFLLVSAGGCGRNSAVAEKEKEETLTTGTTFVGALQTTIDTGRNKVGDPVTVRTLEPVRVNEKTIVPAGATIHGQVTHIDPAGRIAGGAELTLRFTELTMADGTSYAISCEPFRLKGKGDAGESAKEIGGGAVAGGIVGGILGGKKSIVKGAAVGAVLGTGVAVATKGDQIVLPAGQKLKVTLSAPVAIQLKPAPAA
ncbi:MAG TPA: hypothetical protein VGK76_08825 [Candidatus Eisenbacteria bacterium]|jgi:hypothetical protein